MAISGFTLVTGTRVMDASGGLLGSGTITWQPVLSNGQLTSFEAGGNLHGQSGWSPVAATVTNGAFQLYLADSQLTNPVNIAYRVEAIDAATGQVVLGGPGYSRIQPSGDSWDFDTYIPNLTPQLSYVLGRGDKGDTGGPYTGPVVYAKSLGCALDCDVETGLQLVSGGAPTDDTALLQAAINGYAATTSGFCLYMDGCAAITGLFLPGNLAIVGSNWACGFFMLPGSNQHGLRTTLGPVVNSDKGGAAIPERTVKNMLLRNFTLNGNRTSSRGGNGTYPGDPRLNAANTTWLMGLLMDNCSDLRIESLRVINTPTYAMCFNNCGRVWITNCHVNPVGDGNAVHATNQDGIHINGANEYFWIDNCYLRTGDDAIPLNAPEGYGGGIANIAVSSCLFDHCQWAMRMYAAGKSSVVNKVTVTNCSGTLNVGTFYLGPDDPSNSRVDTLDQITVSNCEFSAPAFVVIGSNIGRIAFERTSWNDGASSGVFMPIGDSAVAKTCAVQNLILSSFVIGRTASGNGATGVVDVTASPTMTHPVGLSIKRVYVDGIKVTDVGSAAFYEVYETPVSFFFRVGAGGSTYLFVESAELEGVDARKFAAFCDDLSPDIFSGYGLFGSSLATAFSVPPTLVAARQLFRDSTNGEALSWKPTTDGAAVVITA